MAKKNSTEIKSNYLEKLDQEMKSNQSKVSLVLGALIVLVVAILVFNFFNKNKPSLGPAQQTENQQTQVQPDVTPEKLPGSYTVKDGDTLFIIAQKYYSDGDKFTEIAKANNLTDVDQIETGQALSIPKIEEVAKVAAEPSTGTGGANTTIWGSRIEGNTYTVEEGDWLSKIAGRAYGDIYAFEKIAQANKITDPDHIEPGLVLTIPR